MTITSETINRNPEADVFSHLTPEVIDHEVAHILEREKGEHVAGVIEALAERNEPRTVRRQRRDSDRTTDVFALRTYDRKRVDERVTIDRREVDGSERSSYQVDVFDEHGQVSYTVQVVGEAHDLRIHAPDPEKSREHNQRVFSQVRDSDLQEALEFDFLQRMLTAEVRQTERQERNPVEAMQEHVGALEQLQAPGFDDLITVRRAQKAEELAALEQTAGMSTTKEHPLYQQLDRARVARALASAAEKFVVTQ